MRGYNERASGSPIRSAGSRRSPEQQLIDGDHHVTNQGTESTGAPNVAKGLEGIVAAATQIAEVDGERGRLTLRGYDISELSGRVDFEEVAYLLWHGRLPTRAEYDSLHSEMSQARDLPQAALQALRALAPQASGMHLLRMAASMLSIGDTTVDSL